MSLEIAKTSYADVSHKAAKKEKIYGSTYLNNVE